MQKREEFLPEMWYNFIVRKNHTKQNQEEFFMVDYSTIIGSMKRSILNFTDKISAGMSRPFRKFTADICYGAMSSQSCVISDIAQELQEQTKKIHIVQRLTRNLNEEIPKTVRDNYLAIVKRYLPDHIVVHTNFK